jgi:hypothetical protein
VSGFALDSPVLRKIAGAVVNCGDLFIAEESEIINAGLFDGRFEDRKNPLIVNLENLLGRCIGSDCFQPRTKTQFSEVLAQIVERTNPAQLGIRLAIRLLNRSYFSIKDLDGLRAACARRMAEVAESDANAILRAYLNDGKRWQLLEFWNDCNAEAQRKWLEAVLVKTPERSLDILRLCARGNRSQSGYSMQAMISPDVVYDAAKRRGSEFSEQHYEVREFLEEYGRGMRN